MGCASRITDLNLVGGASGSWTVLVVDDEVLLRMMIAEELRDQGYTAIEAANAHEALSLLESGTVVHVVFTDVQMPGSLDGIDLARIVGNECPEVAVVVTSGRLQRSELAALDRIAGFFPKPYSPRDVAKHIASLFDARCPNPEAAQVASAA
jgi:CheY-like chemotaxis protein